MGSLEISPDIKLAENSVTTWKMEPFYRWSQYGSGGQEDRNSQKEFHTKSWYEALVFIW